MVTGMAGAARRRIEAGLEWLQRYRVSLGMIGAAAVAQPRRHQGWVVIVQVEHPAIAAGAAQELDGGLSEGGEAQRGHAMECRSVDAWRHIDGVARRSNGAARARRADARPAVLCR